MQIPFDADVAQLVRMLHQANKDANKDKGAFLYRLTHEVSECKLCITGDVPNLQMAMDRLQQIKVAMARYAQQ